LPPARHWCEDGEEIEAVMAGFVPAIHVFFLNKTRRGCPAQGRA